MSDIVLAGNAGAGAVAAWDPNSGAPLPAYLAEAMGEVGSNIPDRQNVPSLSYEGKVWQIVKNGNRQKLQMQNSDGDVVPVPVMRAVILNFNGDRGRAYYEGTYNPAAATAPKCWSPDGKRPDDSVKEKMSATCEGCPMSVKGSKVDNGREMVACSSHRMLAVAPAFDLAQDPLRLKIAVTSDYDKELVEHGWFAFRQYVDFLKSKGISHTALVVTKIKFDNQQAYPKLLFALDRLLTAEEVAKVIPVTKSDVVKDLLTEKWTAAGVNGTDKTDGDIKPHGLEGAYLDGWQAHPDAAGYSYKGTEVLANEMLAARYPAPVAPAAPPVAPAAAEPTAPPAPPAAPAAADKPTDPAHIAHAGTPNEVWWDGAAWVKPWIAEAPAVPASEQVIEHKAAVQAPPATSAPKPTDPAHIAHAGTPNEVWWNGTEWTAPWNTAPTEPAAPPAAPAAPAAPPVAEKSPRDKALEAGWVQHPDSPPHGYLGSEVLEWSVIEAKFAGNGGAAASTATTTPTNEAGGSAGGAASTASPSDIPPEVAELLGKWGGGA